MVWFDGAPLCYIYAIAQLLGLRNFVKLCLAFPLLRRRLARPEGRVVWAILQPSSFAHWADAPAQDWRLVHTAYGPKIDYRRGEVLPIAICSNGSSKPDTAVTSGGARASFA